MNNRLVIAGLCFVFVILSGFWLCRTGRPLNVIILTVHKLIAVAAVVYLILTAYRIHQMVSLSPVVIAACAVAILFFVVMIATGGLLSTARTMPTVVLTIHRFMPYPVMLATAASLYLLVVPNPV